MADAVNEAVDVNLIQGEDIEEQFDASALEQLAEDAEEGTDESEVEDDFDDGEVVDTWDDPIL